MDDTMDFDLNEKLKGYKDHSQQNCNLGLWILPQYYTTLGGHNTGTSPTIK